MKMSLLAVLAIILSASVSPQPASADESSSQKAVLITGASTGIGRNAAERLAAAVRTAVAG